MRRLAVLAALLAALLGAGLVASPVASAHATVVASDPVDGARLAAAPTEVTVTFDESVGLAGAGYLRVVDQAGRSVDAGSASHPGGDGTRIAVPLRAGLGDGTYTASFRVVSADSHPVAGAIRFVVGDGSLAAGVAAPSNSDPVTNAVFSVVRWVGFAGLALLGGAWLLATVWPAGRDDARARRLLWLGWALAVFGAVAELAVQGAYAAGTGLGDITRGDLLDATLHTTFGTAHSVRLVLLGTMGVAIGALLRTRWRSRLAEVAGYLGVGVAVSYAASGHASAQNPSWLAMASDSVHLVAMSAWVGGLTYLLIAVLPRRDPIELRAVLPTFSRVAFCSVVALAITGTYQAWLGVGSIDALTSTRYGQLVLVKIGLFVALLGVGNLGRLAVQRRYVRTVAYALTDPPLDDDEPGLLPEIARLRRSVGVEVALAVVVLAVTAVLVAEPPGRAAARASAAVPQSATVAITATRRATVTVNPGRHGPVTITVRLGGGATPVSVMSGASLPAQQLGPIPVPLRATGVLTYSASGVVLPAAGRWSITLTIRMSEFDSTTATATIPMS